MKKIFIPIILALLFSFNNHFAQSTIYVSPSGSSVAPYNSWTTAATNIQVAVDAATTGDLVLVGDGTFTLTTNIIVTKGITIKSNHGYLFTTIDGNSATRCFLIDHASAVVDGFTIKNGNNTGGFGGAANIVSGGTIQNCFISNSQARDGGGVAIDNNGKVENCIITENVATYGGGVRMLNGGITRNCLVYKNTSPFYGGGINIWEAGSIQNCTVVNNTAPNGAGVRCRNASLMENTISYFNNGLNWQTEGSSFSFSNNCTTPALPSGAGNITADPQFADASTDNYHLLTTSPAINAGLNASWMNTSFDLDGRNRILDGTVDIGAFEVKTVIIGGPIPIASWPVGNPTEYSTTPTFNWYLSTYSPGLTFEIQCVAASASWPADNVFATSSTLSFTMPYALTNGVQYAWRVRSTDGTMKSTWSTTALFTIVENTTGQPVVPIASWPVGNPTVYTNPPTLNWYFGTYTTGLSYEIQCVAANASWPADNVFATSSTLSFTMPYALTNGVQYAWRVRSTNGVTKSAWSTTALFTMVENTVGAPAIPIASWPVGNPTEYSNTPTFNWYLPTYSAGLSYEIQCVTASASWPADNVFATSSTLSFTMPYALTNGVQYAWRVRSTNGATKSAWSTTALFTMVANTAGVPVVPVASWPVGNPTEYSITPTFTWYLSSYSPGLTYEIQCVAASASWPADNVFATSSTLSFTMPYVLTNGVQYAWRVRSTNGVTKSAWSTTALFTMVANTIGSPVVPIASWPIGNATEYSSMPTFNWYLGVYSSGLTYEIQCVAASASWPADNVFAVSSTLSFTMPYALTNGVQYAWRVRSTNGVTKSAWSTTALFTMSAENFLVQPIPGNPTNLVTINSSTANLFWYLPTSTAAKQTYEVEIADNPNFLSAKMVSSDKSNVRVDGLEGGKNYFWKVCSKDEIGNSSYYSGIGQFTVSNSVTAIEGKESLPNSFELAQNFPNPFNPTTKISYSLPHNAFVTIKVYDLLGREVRELVNQELVAGNHSIEWNGENNDGNKVASGAFIYRIDAGNFISTKKMILLK